MFCANCGAKANDEAHFCQSCGQSLKAATLPVPATPSTPESLSPASFKQQSPTATVVTVTSRTAQPSPTGSAAVRKGMTQAKFNEENSGIMVGEIMLISIATGMATTSWWWFGGLFLGLVVAMNIKPLAKLLAFVLSLGWGLVGYGIGVIFHSQPASIVLGLLGFMCGLGLHLSAIQWFRDI
ncbi:zinc-ribbon domain-containing protein [Rhodanobacter sp. Si-c]|uniref:Zinc-ribbon domain-containing protein n=1 Tax=Rhodanobacter lycopersici TaxID=3162487 RepID=A0ABV3Q8L4_9GAMM